MTPDGSWPLRVIAPTEEEAGSSVVTDETKLPLLPGLNDAMEVHAEPASNGFAMDGILPQPLEDPVVIGNSALSVDAEPVVARLPVLDRVTGKVAAMFGKV